MYTLSKYYVLQEAYKDNLHVRELEEKMRRAKEAKEKAEKEKQERLAKKKQLVDISSGKLILKYYTLKAIHMCD